MKYRPFICTVIILIISTTVSGYSDIANSVHNLSTSGPGSTKATSEDRICIFCHTPHNSSPSGALWNHGDTGLTFTPYTSSTAIASPGQPTGASLLCLSCHDGTIAMGKIVNPNITITMSGSQTMPTGSSLIGTNLSDDHPISFQYTSSLASTNGELVDPAVLNGAVKLDINNELQCTSCHDPHDNTLGKFLVASNIGGNLCVTCHQKDNWSLTSHNTSSAVWDGVGTNPWPDSDWTNVSNNACQNCHQTHTAGSDQRLLKHLAEEDNCSNCHNAHVAQKDVMADFDKFSSHPITSYTGIHDPSESAIVNSRHVECVDCHNPHAASNSGTPSGPLVGVRGVDSSNNEVTQVTNEYQLCYRCHGDSTGKPGDRTQRQVSGSNVRLEFSTSNASYHPIEGIGQNSNVPSLKSPYTTNSIISCSDCHNSDNPSGPQGPHGSNYEPILELRYETNTGNYSSNDYALCYKCHSEASIRNDESGFLHKKHLDENATPCNVCHDPHGVRTPPGTTLNNTHLINFDTTVVSPNNNGILEFVDQGTFRGTCYLRCHGENHDQGFNYP